MIRSMSTAEKAMIMEQTRIDALANNLANVDTTGFRQVLTRVAQPDESRILMAPLSQSAGGWGQIDGWNSKDDPGYLEMAELVERCIVRKPNENRNGWRPTLEAGAGENWVMKAREEYLRQFSDQDERATQASAIK